MTFISASGALTAAAETFTVDGVNYSLLDDGSGVEVYAGKYTGDLVIPPTVKNGAITYKVVAVGKDAFSYSEVKSVKLPNTVRIIKEMAFNCSDVESVDMGTGIEELQEGAFSVVRSLSSLSEIPAGCVSIDPNGVFLMNTSLKALNVAPDNPMYKSIDGVIYTKSGRTALAFPFGKSAEFAFPDEVDTISANFMNTNKAIEKITFPANLKFIDRNAFTYCTNMVATNYLPQSLEVIAANAFSNCRVLEVTVPSSVKEIGMTAFNNCYMLPEIYISNKLTKWGEQTFYQNRAAKTLTIEANPESIKEIPFVSFKGCNSLEEIIVPEGYESIGGEAFLSCAKVKKVDLPSTLATIGSSAFGTSAPDVIIVRAEVPPTVTNLNYYLFSPNCLETATVYVPAASIDAYKAAGMWEYFTNYRPLTEYNGITDVDGDTQAEAVSVTYYNLLGAEVDAPKHPDGKVYLARTLYSNGDIKTIKFINR